MSSGWNLNASGLEELHRQGVLIPFYGVDLGPGEATRAIDVSTSETWRQFRSTHVNQLYAAATEGRLHDPSQETFDTWPTERERDLWPSVHRGYLYSPFQLLTLNRIRSIVDLLRPVARPDGTTKWEFDPADAPGDEVKEAAATWRSLAVTVSAIDTRVMPEIMQVFIGDTEAWRRTKLAQSPQELLEWLGLSEEVLREQSRSLRAGASFEDDLGEFYDVVRRANPSRWSSLRGSIRTSLDSRVVAQVLDLFADELPASSRTVSGSAGAGISMQPLSSRELSLDAVLTHFHLSPHPTLVVALEGGTEMAVVPRVMRLLGVPDDPNWIRLVDFGGVDANLALLARYAAEPVLGADVGGLVRLDRPVTRFLVLTDAEGKYTTEADRDAQRERLLTVITEALPEDLRPDLFMPDAGFVEIMTWGDKPFEFAHFTDEELADALLATSTRTHPDGRAKLVQAINLQRTRDPSPDIEDAWRGSGVSKIELADALWPLLEAQIERAVEAGEPGPPVMRAVVRAYELAFMNYGADMALRRRGAP